jgi:hypothetical protein
MFEEKQRYGFAKVIMDDESRFLKHYHCRQMTRVSSDEIRIEVPPAIAMGEAMSLIFLSVKSWHHQLALM